MHRTTFNISESVFRQARIKALQEDVTVSEVVRNLLARWVSGEIDLIAHDIAHDPSREALVAIAREARGMWADRDPDAFLAVSRAGLHERDEELTDARLDA